MAALPIPGVVPPIRLGGAPIPPTGGALVTLPRTATLLAPIPLVTPTIIVESTALTTAYTSDQQAVVAANKINLDRVREGHTKPSERAAGTGAYSHQELKEFAKAFGIPVAQTKANLVKALRDKLAK